MHYKKQIGMVILDCAALEIVGGGCGSLDHPNCGTGTTNGSGQIGTNNWNGNNNNSNWNQGNNGSPNWVLQPNPGHEARQLGIY